MDRKDFFKNSIGFLGVTMIAPSLLKSNSKVNDDLFTCSTTNSETAGPFPTITPSSLVRTNMIGDRTGIAFTINLTINNVDANCVPLENAIVDIWHCDKDGNYSQYGGTAMQSTNYTNNTFLRGRQFTDSNGFVSFTSIFPGWYTSRATHIHVHIYDNSGNSLLVTQIAFPESANSAVVLANAATSYGYTKGMTGYTYNATDNVFSDGVTNEMATVSGSVSTGFILTHTIYVAAGTLGSNEFATQEFIIKQSYPNPAKDKITIPIHLKNNSQVTVQVLDINGKIIYTPLANEQLLLGNNNLFLDISSLSSGNYFYKVKVTNEGGIFEQTKKMIIQ
ncbi:conserved hypothetical protein [Flavobacterium sp. 9AF]|uniref:T9SS type A sorting domain-containing protein n=1 Tax=Flavobacterium sp. 9AF TaxID=2653142 RepID=UPI0012F130F8|nr:T9SS type A sorting domain-containing protein [Flavobacterium sp. 9AF]VXB73846.1 conserved hypothetical protein [Flavobacterium sp. 9AF]